MRRATTIGVAVALMMAAGTTGAEAAAPAPALARPTECLDAFDDINSDYVGNGWVGTLVDHHPSNWFQNLFDDTDRDYDLYCGDESSGVVHIGHLDTNGTGHPISPDDEDGFLACWRATIGGGEATPDGPDRTKFTLEYRQNQYAIAYVDNARRFTYTLFTTGANSHDWQPCFVRLM